jgi:hypothetical protein
MGQMDNKDKVYTVEMTEREMQMISNAVAAFYNTANERESEINPWQTTCIQRAFERWKKAIDNQEGLVPKPEILMLNQ